MRSFADRRVCAPWIVAWIVFLCGSVAAQDPPLLAPLSDGAEIALGEVDSAVPTPAQFLGYPLGERFTQYHNVRRYLEAVEKASPRVVEISYGESYEGRPLAVFAITSPANHGRLEELRQAHLRTAEGGDPAEGAPVIVWLAYGVHGNESSSTEAAMAALYRLAAEEGEVAAWLEQAVVLLDPLVNPDGRERYVSGFLQRRGRIPDPLPGALEHEEAWPGGRFNHYGIDLNRDWAWASQQETRQRLALYRQWEPHVYVDYHEMNTDSSYFFPPAAEPILPQIDPRTVGWLDAFGRGNARAMDAQGWVYYKGERFDLFYPGYGDSYPALRGAVGMTYEMAGHGFAGQLIDLPDGRRLSLADRIARHLTTSMATVRTAVEHREGLVRDLAAVRRDPPLQYPDHRTYLWAEEGGEGWELAQLLQRHGVEVYRLEKAAEAPVTRVGRESEGRQSRQLAAGTLLVSTDQPLGALVEVLLEKEAPMQASFLERQRERVEQNQSAEFYDVTAWSLPLAFNLEVWRAEGSADRFAAKGQPAARQGGIQGKGKLGFLIEPQGLATYRLAARLQEEGFFHRLAVEPFTVEGRSYSAGTLFIPSRGNPREIEEWIAAQVGEEGLEGRRVSTAYVSEGISLGSDLMVPVRPGRIGLLAGAGVWPTAHGALWFLLDRMVEAPVTRLSVEAVDRGQLAEFDVLVLPDGRYSTLGEDGLERLGEWVREGGTLIASGGAVDWLRDGELLSVGAKEEEEGDSSEGEEAVRQRRLRIPGAAVATALSPQHPLAAGMRRSPPVLVQGGRYLAASGDPRKDVVVVVEGEPLLAGFAWPEAVESLKGTVLVAAEPVGGGQIVAFADDPAFRLFWRGTMPLFLNAALYGPSLRAAGLPR